MRGSHALHFLQGAASTLHDTRFSCDARYPSLRPRARTKRSSREANQAQALQNHRVIVKLERFPIVPVRATEGHRRIIVLCLNATDAGYRVPHPISSIPTLRFDYSTCFQNKVLLLERWMTKMLATHADTAGRTSADSNKSKDDTNPETATPGNRSDKALESVRHETVARTDSHQNTGRQRGKKDGKTGAIGAATVEGGGGIDGVEGPIKTEEEEKEAAVIRAQMSVLMLGFYEIVRQVVLKIFANDEERVLRVPHSLPVPVRKLV